MGRQRLLVTGMGGELGTRVTNLLEGLPGIEAIAGLDIDPPRRRVPRSEFHRIDPRDRARTSALVREFEPTAVVHFGVYEPNARTYPEPARIATIAGAAAVLQAAATCSSLERIVVRSGIEVYGRPRGAVTRPDEGVICRPSSSFGQTLAKVEQLAADAGRDADVPVTALRFASIVGPHFPSPLGRYLRLPVVPVSAVSDLPFSLVHQEDAAAAVPAALRAGFDGPVNVVGAGAVTSAQAVRLGGRVPLPVVGPLWSAAHAITELVGAPIPDHVRELLVRGRCADGSLAAEALGVTPARTTPDVLKELYEWAPVTYLDVAGRTAA